MIGIEFLQICFHFSIPIGIILTDIGFVGKVICKHIGTRTGEFDKFFNMFFLDIIQIAQTLIIVEIFVIKSAGKFLKGIKQAHAFSFPGRFFKIFFIMSGIIETGISDIRIHSSDFIYRSIAEPAERKIFFAVDISNAVPVEPDFIFLIGKFPDGEFLRITSGCGSQNVFTFGKSGPVKRNGGFTVGDFCFFNDIDIGTFESEKSVAIRAFFT